MPFPHSRSALAKRLEHSTALVVAWVLWTAVAGEARSGDGDALLRNSSSLSKAWAMFALPQVKVSELPAFCTEFDEECQLERAQEYEQAFAAYEKRLPTCSSVGWTKQGILGMGHSATVALRTTPCGLQVAMKGTHNRDSFQAIEMDCTIQKRLGELFPASSKFFPRYYYHSNLTGYCYSERILSVPLSVFMERFNASTALGLKDVKSLIVQGLHGLGVLRKAGVVHQDLTFRNLLIRLDRHESSPAPSFTTFQLVFIDFGSSSLLGRTVPGTPISLLGNKGFPDAYSFACAFWMHFSPEARSCRYGKVVSVPNHENQRTLRSFLEGVMIESKTTGSTPDLELLAAKLHEVDSL